jgi:hypothetical protein
MDSEQIEWFGKLAARCAELGVPVTRVQIGNTERGPGVIISCGRRHWSLVVPAVMWRLCREAEGMDGLALKLEAEACECARSMIVVPADAAPINCKPKEV